MQLDPDDCLLFYRLHQALMEYVNRKLEIVKKRAEPSDKFSPFPFDQGIKIRAALLEHKELIDEFVAENPFDFPAEDLEIVRAWNDLVSGVFTIFRYLKTHTVFLSVNEPTVAYGVLALSDPFESMIEMPLPYLCKAVLLPFKGRIVFDGIVEGKNIIFGAGYRRSIKESYEAAKARQGVVTSLPPPPKPTSKKDAPKAKPKKRTPKAKSNLLGRWRITWMEQWDQDFVDEEVEGFFEFEPKGRGSFHFGYVQGEIDYEEVERDGKPAVEFSWDGNDEMDPAEGRGWAVLDGNEIQGKIFFHQGDDSKFSAKRAEK